MEFKLLKGQVVTFDLYNGRSLIEAKTFYDFMTIVKANKEPIKLSGSNYYIRIIDCEIISDKNLSMFGFETIYNMKVKGKIV